MLISQARLAVSYGQGGSSSGAGCAIVASRSGRNEVGLDFIGLWLVWNTVCTVGEVEEGGSIGGGALVGVIEGNDAICGGLSAIVDLC